MTTLSCRIVLKFLSGEVGIWITRVTLTQRSYKIWVRVMMFNATFNDISVVLWQSVVLVDETGVPGENNAPATRR